MGWPSNGKKHIFIAFFQRWTLLSNLCPVVFKHIEFLQSCTKTSILYMTKWSLVGIVGLGYTTVRKCRLFVVWEYNKTTIISHGFIGVCNPDLAEICIKCLIVHVQCTNSHVIIIIYINVHTEPYNSGTSTFHIWFTSVHSTLKACDIRRIRINNLTVYSLSYCSNFWPGERLRPVYWCVSIYRVLLLWYGVVANTKGTCCC